MAHASLPTWGSPRAAAAPQPTCCTRLRVHLSTGIAEEQHAANPIKMTREERLRLKHKMEESWYLRLGSALESHYAHSIVLLLIFLDVVLVASEVMLREVCPAPDGGYPRGSWQYTRINHWGEGISWISRSILLLLLLHQVGLMVAYGCLYWQKVAYVIDFAIVATALGLEMTHLSIEIQQHAGHRRALQWGEAPRSDSSHSGHSAVSPPDDATNLIIVLLVWRVLRVVHGITVTSLEQADDSELREAKARVSELEAELRRLRGDSEGGGESKAVPLVAAALARSASDAPPSLPVSTQQP